MRTILLLALVAFYTVSCKHKAIDDEASSSLLEPELVDSKETIIPIVVTQKVKHDSDDPAIWINHEEPEKSVVFGTDKNSDGAIYAFDLEGKIIEEKTIRNLKRPNNVDIEYGFQLGDRTVDILAFTERERTMLRVYSIPDIQEIDGGGIPVFQGEPEGDFTAPMGIALYKNPETQAVYAIVGRKNGPTDGSYLWQYELSSDSEGAFTAEPVRKFGRFSGEKEIEAIAVDEELGHIYYSDEMVGIRQYHADPSRGNQELALFGTEGFAEDIEGIAIWPKGEGNGFILVSDQQAQSVRVFKRDGNHDFVKTFRYAALETDGMDLVAFPFSEVFPLGFLAAMSDDHTFHFYDLRDLGL